MTAHSVEAVESGRRRQLVDAALDILEAEGPDGLTMRSLAERVGIRAPSLYKHVADKDELTALLIAEAFRGLTPVMYAAVVFTYFRLPDSVQLVFVGILGFAAVATVVWRVADVVSLR